MFKIYNNSTLLQNTFVVTLKSSSVSLQISPEVFTYIDMTQNDNIRQVRDASVRQLVA